MLKIKISRNSNYPLERQLPNREKVLGECVFYHPTVFQPEASLALAFSPPPHPSALRKLIIINDIGFTFMQNENQGRCRRIRLR